MKKLFPVLLFALITLLAFWKVLFHREFTLVVGDDTAGSYYAWFDVAAYWLKKGTFLLWDPYVYSGKLNMGEPQPGLYYPLNWLFMLLPARGGGMNVDGMQALMMLDYLLAGIFFYHLGRSLGLSRYGATVGGVAWSYGGFTAQISGYVNVLSGFVWLPPTLLYFRRALLSEVWKARLRHCVASGLFLALSFLPGHHIPPVHIGFLLLLYALFVIVRDWNQTHWSSRISTAVSLGLVAVTGIALTSLQWLPSAEWARRTYRWIGGDALPVKWGQAVPYSALQHASNLSPQDAVSLLLPYVSTNANLYTGIAVLFLALVGILFVRKTDSRFFALAAFLYLFISWGRFSALHGWVNTFVPTIWFAREVFYYLVIFQACLALLAGWGLDYLREAYSDTPDADFRAFIRGTGWIMTLLVIFSAVFVAVLHIYGGLRMDHPYFKAVGGLAVYACVTGVLLFLLHTRRIQIRQFSWLLVGLVVLDLSSHISSDIKLKRPPNNEINTYVPEYWKVAPDAEFLVQRRREEIFRVDDAAGAFPSNFGDVWRLESTMGHGATALVDYFEFRGTGWGPGSNASALLNARYFLSRVSVPGMKKVFGENDGIYRNPRAVPRVFAAARYRAFADDKELLDWFRTPMLAPGETVLLRQTDIDKLSPTLLTGTINEDPGISIRVLSCETASDRLARTATDEETRHRLNVFRAPWGWTVGDLVKLSIRPQSRLDYCYLVLNYIPTSEQASRVRVLKETPAGKTEIEAQLPGLKQGLSEPERTEQAIIDLGEFEPQDSVLTLSRTEECSANLDSIRISPHPPLPGESECGDVKLTSLKPNQLKLSAALKRPSFVVLSEVYYPGWEAWIDGRPAPLLKADYILRAVPVPAGQHEIILRFRSGTLVWGLMISLLSLLAVVLILFPIRNEKKASGGSTDSVEASSDH